MHIGRRIEQELRLQGRSVSWFARQLPTSRVNVYDIFRRESVDTRLLMRISILLNHNFFTHLSRELDNILGKK